MKPLDISLYAILDPTRTRGRDLAAMADAAATGGATLLQLRDKTASTRAFIASARAVRDALAGRIPLLINDRVDVALAARADGVHIGRDDMLPADVRRLLGPGAIIGVTLKSEADLASLDPALADYGCIGGVFATVSKDNPDTPVGLEGLRRLRDQARAARLPVGAIAGIDATNAAATIAAGADGVAIISALFMADDVAEAARHLKSIVGTALNARGA